MFFWFQTIEHLSFVAQDAVDRYMRLQIVRLIPKYFRLHGLGKVMPSFVNFSALQFPGMHIEILSQVFQSSKTVNNWC